MWDSHALYMTIDKTDDTFPYKTFYFPTEAALERETLNKVRYSTHPPKMCHAKVIICGHATSRVQDKDVSRKILSLPFTRIREKLVEAMS